VFGKKFGGTPPGAAVGLYSTAIARKKANKQERCRYSPSPLFGASAMR
jgi:hypothetical protein